MKGQLFGYPLGEKDPVQIQAWIGVEGLNYDVGRLMPQGGGPGTGAAGQKTGRAGQGGARA